MREALARNADYSADRRRFREVNGHPGPLPGYGGRGTSVVSQDKLAVTNPKHSHAAISADREFGAQQTAAIQPMIHPLSLGGQNSGFRPTSQIETTGFIEIVGDEV